MKIWLDDIREPPVGWTWVKTADECIEALKSGADAVSLDHDLADMHYANDFSREKTGYDVTCWLEQNPEFVPKYINLHTLNPVGRQRMKQVCERFGVRLTIITALEIAAHGLE